MGFWTGGRAPKCIHDDLWLRGMRLVCKYCGVSAYRCPTALLGKYSLDPRLSRAPARKESLAAPASFEGFLVFFERTLNDVMRDRHVTNTRFRSGFPFCLCAHAHMHIPYRQLHSSWTLNRPAVDIRSRHSSHYQWEVKRIHLGPKQIVLSLGPVFLSEVCSLRPEQPP